MTSFSEWLDKIRKTAGDPGGVGGGPGGSLEPFQAALMAIGAGALDLAKAVLMVPQDTPDDKFLFGVWFSVTFWFLLKKTRTPEALASGAMGLAEAAVGEVGETVPL